MERLVDIISGVYEGCTGVVLKENNKQIKVAIYLVEPDIPTYIAWINRKDIK